MEKNLTFWPKDLGMLLIKVLSFSSIYINLWLHVLNCIQDDSPRIPFSLVIIAYKKKGVFCEERRIIKTFAIM